jgi:DNA modification methylase
MKIIHGDCLDILKGIDTNSIDSLVTDPPAGISFMGKEWDSNKGGSKEWIKWMSQVMSACLRVLKPGAHALVWAIPRTSHWTATALEDAGFEIRDVVTHLFGSGFPKSLDISKAIDKAAGLERERVPGGQGGVNQILGSRKSGEAISGEAKQWQGFGTALKPASEHWILCRKPISEKTVAANVLKWGCGGINIDKSRIPANNEAWENEENLCDLCVKRVANNARQSTQETKESIAAENADIKASEKTLGILPDVISSEAIGCSDETSKENTSTSLNMSTCGKSTQEKENKEASFSTTSTRTDPTTGLKTCSMCAQPLTSNTTRITGQGRFPSNLVLSHNPDCVEVGVKKVGSGELKKSGTRDLDGPSNSMNSFNQKVKYAPDNYGTETVAAFECTPGCAVAELDRQSGVSGGDKRMHKKGGIAPAGNGQTHGHMGVIEASPNYQDSDGASRFFYCAKASKRERNEGCEGLPEKTWKDQGYRDNDSTHLSPRAGAGRTSASANHHPTVKPLKLMSYLIRMITPPGGIVLDPFCGSGSTGVAAKKEGFQFLGIEREKEYIEIAKKRIYHKLPLFRKEIS